MTPSLLHRTITYPGPDGEVLVPLVECNIFCTIDSAGGADEHNATTQTDKVGWCVNAVDVHGHWLILELADAYLTDERLVEKLYELDDKYAPRFGMEAMPHLAMVLRLLFARNQRTVHYVPLKHGKRNKVERITRLRSQLKYIHFLEEIRPGAQHLLRNWFTAQSHGDDALDALGYMLDIARPPSIDDIAARRQQHEKRLQEAALSRLPRAEREECQKWIDYDKRQGHRHINEEIREFMGLC